MFERCYPKVTDWLYLVTNEAIDLRFLPIYSYGFWVAMGFLAAAVVVTRELKRREALGVMSYSEQVIHHRRKINFFWVLLYAVIGYFIGTKAVPMLTETIDPFMAGIGLALAAGGLKLWESYKNRPKKDFDETVIVYPSDLVGDMVMICAVFGVTGANFFNYLESPEDYINFWQDPIGSMFSGLSVYGGMITAGIVLLVYCYRKKINIPHFFDSVCMAFILANGIGRLGCQTSGDGDWGVVNLAAKPDWIPQFLWANTYPHNIVNEGVFIQGCREAYCMVLPQPVYPTPIYEFLMCLAIFFILYMLRKRLTSMAGMLVFIFFILIGIQRYLIEQIRDLSGRDLYYIFGAGLKQSELISIILVIVGSLGCVWTWNYYKRLKKQ